MQEIQRKHRNVVYVCMMPAKGASKGQLITEWYFGAFKSPKKQTKFQTYFCPMKLGAEICQILVGFLGDFKTPKSYSEINWPFKRASKLEKPYFNQVKLDWNQHLIGLSTWHYNQSLAWNLSIFKFQRCLFLHLMNEERNWLEFCDLNMIQLCDNYVTIINVGKLSFFSIYAIAINDFIIHINTVF